MVTVISPRRSLLLLALLAAVATGGLADPNIYRANSLYRLGKFEKLLQLLEDLEDGPPRLFLFKGEALANLDRRREAIEAYQKLIARYPDHPDGFDARRKVMLLLDQDKNYQALVEVIREFRAGDPQGRMPYNRLEADAHFKAGRHAEALALLEGSDDEADQRTLAEILRELGRADAYLGEHPVPGGDFPAARRRGLLLEHLSRAAEAAAQFGRALELRPDDRFCLERLALAALGSDDEAGAMARYRRLVELAPGELKYGAQLGKLLWRSGEKDEARRVWRGLLGHGAADPQRLKLVVRLFLEHEDPAAALELIRGGRRTMGEARLLLEEEEQAQLMQRDLKAAAAVWVPQLVQPRGGDAEADPRERILELAAASPKHMDAALAALGDAMILYPGLVEFTLLADELLRLAGREAEVPALLERLVQAVGDDPGQLHEFALRFREQGLHLEASLLYLAARERLPVQDAWGVSLEGARELRALGKAAEARQLLAPFFTADAETLPMGLLEAAVDLEGRLLLEDLGANAQARSHFSAWIPRLDPDSPYVVPWVILAARGAAATGDFQAAEAAYKALLERGGNKQHTAEIHYRLGRLHLFAGHLEEARQILRRIGEEYPDAEVANDAVEEVAFLLDHRDAGEEALRHFLGLRHLVEARREADYRAALGKLEPEEVPAELRDDYLMLEARVLAREGKREQLTAVLRRGADEEPEGPLVPQFLWRLAEGLGEAEQVAEAEAAWREYLVRVPDSLRLEEVRARLKGLERRRKGAAIPPAAPVAPGP